MEEINEKKLPAALLFVDFRKAFFSIIMIYKKKKKKKPKVHATVPQQYSVLLGKNKMLKYNVNYNALTKSDIGG